MHKQVLVFLAVVLSFLASTCTLNTAELAVQGAPSTHVSGNSSQIANGLMGDAINLLQKKNLTGALNDLLKANVTHVSRNSSQNEDVKGYIVHALKLLSFPKQNVSGAITDLN